MSNLVPQIIYDDWYELKNNYEDSDVTWLPQNILKISFQEASQLTIAELAKQFAPFTKIPVSRLYVSQKGRFYGARMTGINSTDWCLFTCEQDAFDWLANYHSWPQCDLCKKPISNAEVRSYIRRHKVDPEECVSCGILRSIYESFSWGEPIRITYLSKFTLVMWNANHIIHNRHCVAMRLIDDDTGETIFDSAKDKNLFLWTATDKLDSNNVVKSVLQNLTIRPEDSDKEYFKNYNEKQMIFAKKHAVDVAAEGMARFGE